MDSLLLNPMPSFPCILPSTNMSNISFSTSDTSDLSQTIYQHFSSFNKISESEEEKIKLGISLSSKGIQKPQTSRKDKYNVIPNQTRLQLIDLVLSKKQKLRTAAKTLNLNYSSAKSILQVYRREGRLEKKSSKKNTAKKQQQRQQETLESNLANLFDHAGSTSCSESPLVLPDETPTNSQENTKSGEESAISSDRVINFSSLGIKLQRSEAQSNCLPANPLLFGRNCSAPTELNRYQQVNRLEPPTFFATSLKNRFGSMDGFADLRYVQSLLLHQQQQKYKEQNNELIKELLKSKLLNHQLNQIRNLNSLLEIQNQIQYHH